MSFNVQNFRATMTGDGARPNLFDCIISFPNGLIEGAVQQKIKFTARAAQLPGSTVNQVPVNYFGRELKFSGNRAFADWTVTIINDEDFIIRNQFERWMSNLNSHVANFRAPGFTSPANYQAEATVTQYAKEGGVLKDYRFVGIFPVDVSPIEMDWGANDSIEEFTVTFAYQWWESVGTGINGNYTTTDSSGAI